MRYKPVRGAFCFNLLGGLTESQGRTLRNSVGHEHVMMFADRVERMCECNEVARYESCSLMQQLEERVLSVGPSITPADGARWLGYLRSDECDMLPVALHN